MCTGVFSSSYLAEQFDGSVVFAPIQGQFALCIKGGSIDR